MPIKHQKSTLFRISLEERVPKALRTYVLSVRAALFSAPPKTSSKRTFVADFVSFLFAENNLNGIALKLTSSYAPLDEFADAVFSKNKRYLAILTEYSIFLKLNLGQFCAKLYFLWL